MIWHPSKGLYTLKEFPDGSVHLFADADRSNGRKLLRLPRRLNEDGHDDEDGTSVFKVHGSEFVEGNLEVNGHVRLDSNNMEEETDDSGFLLTYASDKIHKGRFAFDIAKMEGSKLVTFVQRTTATTDYGTAGYFATEAFNGN